MYTFNGIGEYVLLRAMGEVSVEVLGVLLLVLPVLVLLYSGTTGSSGTRGTASTSSLIYFS